VKRILVIGEAIADFLPLDETSRRFACVLGGSGFNTALALSRLGLSPLYVATLSHDALGRRFQAVLAAEGMDPGAITLSDRPMPVAIVQPSSASHGAMFALHLAGTVQEVAPAHLASLERQGLPHGSHVHVASFAGTVGASAEASLALLRTGRQGGSTSYDPNIRAACLPPHREAVALIEARVAASTIAKASEEDLAWIYPGLPPDQALQRWLVLGAGIAIVTRGAQGALALTAHGVAEAAGEQVTVVDTVGAGDTFTAGFLAAMASDGALGNPGHVAGSEQVRRWLGLANRAAAITCARAGCDPPRWEDLA
jgi:fructokinase